VKPAIVLALSLAIVLPGVLAAPMCTQYACATIHDDGASGATTSGIAHEAPTASFAARGTTLWLGSEWLIGHEDEDGSYVIENQAYATHNHTWAGAWFDAFNGESGTFTPIAFASANATYPGPNSTLDRMLESTLQRMSP